MRQLTHLLSIAILPCVKLDRSMFEAYKQDKNKIKKNRINPVFLSYSRRSVPALSVVSDAWSESIIKNKQMALFLNVFVPGKVLTLIRNKHLHSLEGKGQTDLIKIRIFQ